MRSAVYQSRLLKFSTVLSLLVSFGVSFLAASRSEAVLLFPDLVSVASVEDEYMYGGVFDTLSEPGRVLYRFDVAIANLGDGAFQVTHETDLNSQTQDINQEVFDSKGGIEKTLMGTFDFEQPPFGRLVLEALARYNLREVVANQEVGDVLVTHDKTSHAVVDSRVINLSLPNAPTSPVYQSAWANPLGISVGYADLYGRNIAQQRIDVTGLASGQYWLEVIVDPNGYVQESDDSNNVTRILVDLDIPTTGDYDNDQDVDGTDFLEWQRGISPNFLSAEDLQSWSTKFGTTYPPPAAALGAAIVPEPTTWVLVAASCLLALGSRLFFRHVFCC